MPELAYLNGTFLPIADARVSIEDRGFQFADGVYEVIVYHGKRAVMLEAHLERLANSCRGIHLNIDLAGLKLADIIEKGVHSAGFRDTMVYVQITRGAAPRDHVYPRQWQPTVVMTFKAKPVVSDERRRRGLSVMTIPDSRWSRCDIKSIALLPNVMARNEALTGGYDDAVFIGPQGDIREASASNLFVIRDARLLTPPQDHTILPGITRQLVLRCARRIELAVIESRVTRQDLLDADEAFASSTTMDVLAVTRVDGRPIGDGLPGPITAALAAEMAKELHHRDTAQPSAANKTRNRRSGRESG